MDQIDRIILPDILLISCVVVWLPSLSGAWVLVRVFSDIRSLGVRSGTGLLTILGSAGLSCSRGTGAWSGFRVGAEFDQGVSSLHSCR